MSQPPSRRKKAKATAQSNSKQPNNPAQEDDPASATIDVTAVEIPELTEAEQSDRLLLERKVERAFFEAGKALMELRDRRLYRSTHKTFEEYCRDRFGHSRRQSYLLMDAAVVFDNLAEKCDQFDHKLPTAEGQVRPLTKLEPQQQQEVWLKAVVKADGKVPTGKIVKDIVQEVMERTQVPNTYQLGEVCQILAKDNPDLKGKSGCWAIVSQVNDFSCTVRMWDGEYTVAVKHLKSFEYLPAECEQMRLLCDRITRVYSSSLEESLQKFLESLGKLNRHYLTMLEEKVLSLLELEIKA